MSSSKEAVILQLLSVKLEVSRRAAAAAQPSNQCSSRRRRTRLVVTRVLFCMPLLPDRRTSTCTATCS